MIAGNACNPCGGQMMGMVMVPMGVVPGGGATPGTTPDGVGTAFDFNSLTAAQKDQIVSIVETGYDFSTLSAAQKAALIAALGVGTGTGTGVDGIAPTFDLSTLTAAQKAALVTIVAAGLDFSTLSAAQKTQIQAIAGSGAALTPAQLAATIVAAPASTATGANVPTSIPAVNSAGTLVETAIVPLPAAIPATYGPINTANAAANTVIPVASVTVPADGWYVYNMSIAGNIVSNGLPVTIADSLGLYVTNGPLASGKQVLGFNVPMVLQAAKATVAGERLAAFRYSGPSEPFFATAGTVINAAAYTPAFVTGITFTNIEAVSPNSLQRISGNYLV